MASRANGYSSTSTSTSKSTKRGSTGSSNIWAMNGNGGPASSKTPFRHIEDLTSVGVDLDPHTPLRKVLEIGDSCMRQACTYSEFGRPDLALQEYIKAFTIAVDTIPKHKDYPSLKAGSGDLSRLYNALKAKITKNGETFDKIKILIKEDNKRSGVQPARSSQTSSDVAPVDLPSAPSSNPSQSQISKGIPRQNGTKPAPGFTEQRHSEASGPKSRPVVHPKPQALHGNAIKSGSSSMSHDLNSRFAKLRDPQPSNGALPLKPAGPREMPVAQRAKPSVDSSVPPMPKVPDAIYSPARGTITSEVAALPSSTPRGMFSRTNSIASVPSASARTSMENAIKAFSGEQFVTAHMYKESPPTPQPSGIEIPEGETITPQELLNYMKKAQLLVIDVRDREAFDDGHILSQRTICVEPEVLSRENISADDIQDSMILADPAEKLAFELRDKVDLVVVYDQDSTSVPKRITRSSQGMVIYTMMNALSHYNYTRQLRNPPKLLAGGLDAWVEELGLQSLAVSKTNQSSRRPRGPRVLDRRRARTKTKTLNQEEIEQFEQSIKADEAASSSNDYYRSAEEVMRRFPSVSQLQESMTSPRTISSLSDEERLYNISPAPPARPAPAVPRTRYSGLETKDDGSSSAVYAKKSGASLARKKRTGLENPYQWCYCNSVLQALLASPQFANELTRSDWPVSWRAANHSLERPSPQLLARILGSIFQYLNNRQFEVMRAALLMNYLRSIHQGYEYRNRIIKFGDNEQHDAEELTTFLLDQLDMETNTKRNTSAKEPDFKTPKIQNAQAPLGDVLNTWLSYYDLHHSIVDKYWQNVISQEFTCTNPECNAKSYKLEAEPFVVAYPADSTKGSQLDSLPAAFDREFAPDEVLESTCETCKNKHKRRRNFLLRAAPLLCVKVLRTIHTTRVPLKNTFPMEFPFDGLDLRKHRYDKEQLRPFLGTQPTDMLGGYEEDPIYDLYAVVIHNGPDSHSGHYWTWVREGSGSLWTKCNDSSTDEVDMDRQIQRELFECKGKETPVMLFYKRKDIPWASREG
ncbi:hypothetical protein DL768_010518 [Monosporascus sp. mg162]|nr:hypothetical protein DL768_010518 [Monosporascus sp. mg162]